MATIREGTYWDNRPAITSNSLFAHERKKMETEVAIYP